jgi:nucleotide sugar dehydrogenase
MFLCVSQYKNLSDLYVIMALIMDQNTKETIVIVGFGWVGQANAVALKYLGYPTYYFDIGTPNRKYEEKYKDIYNSIPALSKVLEKDSPNTWYIVCVGDRVSEDGNQDISLIQKALETVRNAKGNVILRSTILPGFLASLKFDFYVPEFLHEKRAVEECLSPHYFVVGKRSEVPEPSFFSLFRRRAIRVFKGTPEEASYIKYLSNLWNSMRIAFVNEFGNAIALPTDPKHLAQSERVINFFFENKSYLRYGRSFGGHCLPKDTRAFIAHHKEKGKTMSLLEGAYASNTAHQVIEKKYPILPEWFSEWVRPEMSGRVAIRVIIIAIIRRLGLKSKKSQTAKNKA